MRLLQKKNIPIRTINVLVIGIVCLVFFIPRSCNKYYDLLSSKKTVVGIANVYDWKAAKGSDIHKYVYKAFGKFYFGQVSSYQSNLYIDENISLKSFLIVYRSDNPNINVLIYQKSLPLNFNLDTVITQKKNLSVFVKRNTWENDDAENADKNDFEELEKYQLKKKKWMKKMTGR